MSETKSHFKDALTDITDMSDSSYDINEVKHQYRELRNKKRKNFRSEGNLDEDGEAFKKAFDRQIMGRLLKHLRPYVKQTLLAILLLGLYSAIVPIFPYLMQLSIDRYINPTTEPFSGMQIEARFNGLVLLLVVYFVLRLVSFALRYGYTYLISWLGQYVIYDIRKEIFAKIQRLHLGFFDRTPVGRLMTRITSDTEAIQRMISDGVVGLIADVGLMIGIMIYMFRINWQLTLVTLAVMPLLFLSLNFLRSRLRDAYRVVRLRLSQSNTYLQENLTGMKTVQLFNRESRNQQKFDKINLDLLEAYIEQVRWFSLFWPTVKMVGGLATVLILFYGVQALDDGVSSTITIGVLTSFLFYSNMFFRPIQDLSDKYNIMQAAMASCERIFGLLDTEEAIVNKPEPTQFETSFRGEVVFEDVWFAYDKEDWVLREVSFKVAPGESVAFVGHTGAGKTTIISLVSRFYDVQRGSVKIDGKDVRDYEQVELRKHIGIVLQDPFLFSGTIKSNITLNDDSIALDRVIEAAKFVNAHEFINRLPDGYNTEVLERGAGFSTGQKQLIAFARALVQNPDILLVLDEATANIDTETEELIQDALKKLMQGRTSIVIAHRLSTIQDVNRIMVMRKGKLIERGNHFELLKQDGYYRRLYELQYR